MVLSLAKLNYELLCCGDATDLSTWSNIPYYLYNAGKKKDLFSSAFSLKLRFYRLHKFIWNCNQLLRFGYPGGFQYSEYYLNRLFRISGAKHPSSRLILSNYPLLPSNSWPSTWRVSYYIDATTKQVFNDYQQGRLLAPAFKNSVIKREKANYLSAQFLITMSDWAAQSLICDYHLPESKVFTVPAGSNLDEDSLLSLGTATHPPSPNSINPLRLGFLGKDWERKGGPFVLSLVQYLSSRGIPSVVRVIGPKPQTLPSSPFIQPLGFIDKHHSADIFLKELSTWHYGTLFSTIEAFGISNRECLSLGVPVIAHDVGGISSTFSDGICGKLFPPFPKVETVGDWIINEISDYERYLILRDCLWKRRLDFTWATSVRKLKQILQK